LKEFLFKLDIIAPAFSLTFAFILFKIRKRKISFPDLILLGFLIVELLLNIVSAILQVNKKSNLEVYLLNLILIQLLFTYYFLKVLIRKKIVYFGFALFCLCTLLIVKGLQISDNFASYPYAFSSLIILIYSLVFLHQILDTLPSFNILSLKEFWIITGTLTYFGSTFLIFISYHYLSVIAPKQVHVLWQLHNIFLCFGCLIFSKAINCKKWAPK